MQNKKTIVLGASENPERYSYLAVNALTAKGHDVIAVGRKAGKIGSIPIETRIGASQNVHTVTLYLNAENQKAYYDEILALHPKRIIFNPGAENSELAALAHQHQIEPKEACTLVLLSTGMY